ncbi:VWA domain-containing protein [Flavihumibacter stibioxidans]|uniref:VWA containing CoxE family protein n=1 Tax=Flavihumibacter stibioxidans TaxID=1834163 RepID=A0ABR7MB70_9BACT|nr:VWA domain-containing protein [Flavihumibacter stibioxidans]MBC6492212.1 VWA containing CoxE family protein [Flavihumibacter stibioxidans]
MISRQTSLAKNIILFCRFLRTKGYAIGPPEENLLLLALAEINIGSKQEYQLAMRATLCKSQKELEQFDDLFRQFWKELDKAVDAKEKQVPEKKQEKPKPGPDASFRALQTWLHGNRNKDTEETATFSTRENLARKDFSNIPDDELYSLQQYLRTIARKLSVKANRRHEPSGKTRQPDLRRTLRKNLRRGGELLDIVYRRPKKNRMKLVILCDASRSMELYTAFLLQFLYAFQQVFNRVETFVFSTGLKRITSQLKQQEFSDTKKILGTEKLGWSGGTRIGACLADFVREYADNLLDKKTIVIILSDGWDTGDPHEIAGALSAIHNKSKKIIWLNPLAGHSGYQPDTAGMQAALPYIDVLAAAHNADSLKKLGNWL